MIVHAPANWDECKPYVVVRVNGRLGRAMCGLRTYLEAGSAVTCKSCQRCIDAAHRRKERRTNQEECRDAILEVLGSATEPLSVSAIAEQVGISMQRVARLLPALSAEGEIKNVRWRRPSTWIIKR